MTVLLALATVVAGTALLVTLLITEWARRDAYTEHGTRGTGR